MNKIKSTIFSITEEEVREIFDEMTKDGKLKKFSKLDKKQIAIVLDYVECDEFLAKDIRTSIQNSICEVLESR